MACLGARLVPDAMARLLANLDPFTQAEFDQARQEGRRDSHDAYRADALVATAEASGTTVAADARDDDGGRPRPRSAPTTLIALVSHDALVRGRAEPGETCEVEGVGSVPVATVKQMMGDAFLAAVVTDGVDIRSVAHLGLHPTSHQRTALAERDRCCVVPGCSASQGLEIDHVTGWAVTHLTCLDDLARLCKKHHRMKTTGGWHLGGPPGHWTWTHPDQPVSPETAHERPAAQPRRPTDQTRVFTPGTDPPTT